MTSVDEFRKYLKIDKHRLDEELEEQPVLLFQVSEAYVQAAAERDMLKEQLAAVDADLDSTVRADLDRKEDKFTEAMVKSGVQLHKKHERASEAYFEAKKQADLLQALKEAFQSRGYMIRDLCSLYSANYYEKSSMRPTDDTKRTTYSMGRRARERLREDV